MERQSFHYKGKVLIEKGVFIPPFHHEVVFQQEHLEYTKPEKHRRRMKSGKRFLQGKEPEALYLLSFFDPSLQKYVGITEKHNQNKT